MNKKLLKNFCAVFLAWFMALLLLSQSAQAQEKEAYVVKSSDNKTLTFYYDDQKTSRTGTVWGTDETKQDGDFVFPAWSGTNSTPESEVTTAVFDDSFKNFLPKTTESWFFKFTNLEEIKGLENLNTSEVTTMSSMFFLCKKLSQLDLSNFNTEKVENMHEMFLGCSSLTSLDLSSFNTEKVQYMGRMFTGCSSLTSLDLSSFNTEKVQYMHGMFWSCSSLTSLNLSSFNTEKVQEMSRMFSDCQRLTSLDLSNFNTENVQNMMAMFYASLSLTSLDLSSFNTENVKYMGYMFGMCSSLTSLDLSNFNTEKVQDMSKMFVNCESLRTIYCNNTWTSAESMQMFLFCEKLKGAVPYDASKIDVSMANPETGYFTKKEGTGVATATTDGDANIQAIYSTDGRRLKELQSGLNIVRMSNGTTQKVLRK
nr:BspA family leucine-rich repeat surface protein [uncultured Alloprevotella sp.]